MVFGIIPARLGSSRFFGKPLVPIGGIPMVVRVYRAVIGCDALDGVVVATDSLAVVTCCCEYGVPVVMTNSGHVCGSDRIYEAARLVGIKCDDVVVLNIQGDEPLVTHGLVKSLATCFDEPGVGQAILTRRLDGSHEAIKPDIVKVSVNSNGWSWRFTRSVFCGQEQFGTIGLFGFRFGSLWEFVKAPRTRVEIQESIEQARTPDKWYCKLVDEVPIAVDRPEDVKRVEEVLRRHGG